LLYPDNSGIDTANLFHGNSPQPAALIVTKRLHMNSIATQTVISTIATDVKNDSTTITTPANAQIAEMMNAKVSILNGAVFELERLEGLRQHWEGNELAASHNRLYSVLTECYEFYQTMKSAKTGKTIRDAMKSGLDSFILQRNYTSISTTHDMNRVVKAVFGIDRRRVSAYSLALRAALVKGPVVDGCTTPVPASQLAEWLSNEGGVEQVRLGSKNNGMTAKNRAEIAKIVVKDLVLLTIKPDAKTMPFDTEDSDRMVLLVATYRPSGELEISAVVKNDTAVRGALAAYYSVDKVGVQSAADKASVVISSGSAISLALGQ